jgi:RNA polymerase sigma-70 factor (ECF subfamily)
MSLVETTLATQAWDAQESVRRLRAAMQQLPPKDKEVFLLRQNGGLTYEQVARLLKRPVGVVKGQMRSVLRKLRAVLLQGSSGACKAGSAGEHGAGAG